MLNIVFPVVSLIAEFLLAIILLFFWGLGVNKWEPLPQFGEMGGVYPILGVAVIMTSILSGNWVYMFITRYKQCFEEPKTRKLPEYYFQLLIILFLVLVIHGTFTLLTTLGWIGCAGFPVVMFLVLHLIFKILYFGGFTFCVFCWVIEDVIVSFVKPRNRAIYLFLFLRVTITIISFLSFIVAFVASTGINIGLDTDSIFASIDYSFVILRMCFYTILIMENIWISITSGYFEIKKEINRVKNAKDLNERREQNKRRKKRRKKRKRRISGASGASKRSKPSRFMMTDSSEEEFLLPVEGGDLLNRSTGRAGRNRNRYNSDGVYLPEKRWDCRYCNEDFPTEIDLLSHIQYAHPFHMKDLLESQIAKLANHRKDRVDL